MPEEGEAGKYRCAVCGAEKEFLDEWDMTVELFAEIMGVSMYAVTYTYNQSAAAGELYREKIHSEESGGSDGFTGTEQRRGWLRF